MGSNRKPDKMIAKALEAAMGNISVAARAMGYSRSNLHLRIHKSPALQQMMRDQRETMTDNAESSLNRAILGGEGWAVCFYLKCQGKARGYVERQEIHQETKLTLSSNMEGLSDAELEAIVRGVREAGGSGGATAAEAPSPG